MLALPEPPLDLARQTNSLDTMIPVPVLRQSVGVLLALPLIAAGCGRSEQPEFPAARASAHRAMPELPPDMDRTSPLPDPLPDVAAMVNGSAIATSQVRAAAEKRLAALGAGEDRKIAYRTTMHQYITRQLLYQEAERRGLLPDDEALAKAEVAERERHGDAAALAAWLEGEGIADEGLRAELRIRLAVVALAAAMTADAKVSDQEAREHHRQYPKEFPGKFEDVAEKVKAHLTPQKEQQVVEGLITRLRKEATIETFLSTTPPPVATAGDSEPEAAGE